MAIAHGGVAMNLRLGFGTVALTVTLAGSGICQEPAGEVLTIRTSGQPERKVTVLRTERLPDGNILADVRDVATGITYTLTNPSGLKSETAAPRLAMPVPAMLAGARTIAPQTPITTTPIALRPIQSPTRPVFDPTGGPSPSTKLVSFTDMPSAKPNPNARRQTTFPTNESLVPVESVAPNPAAQYMAQTRPRYVDPQIGKNATNVPQSTANYQTTSAYGTAPAPAKQPPSVLGKLFGANDAKPKPQPRVGVLPPPSIITNAGTPVARRPVAELPSAEALPVAAAAIIPVAKTEPIAAVVPEVNEEPELTDKQLTAMINELVKNIQSHPRPSLRMTNATKLAECKAAAQQDVKELLAFAAENDAIGVVRGHCIGLLSKMGHADADYIKTLEVWTTDTEPAVQSAAIAALAKLR